MKNFWPLVFMQLKDKLDLSWVKQKKSLIQKIVFAVIKFLLLGGIVFALLYILNFLMIIYKSEVINFYIIFFALMFVLSLFSITTGLMKSLYFADDNKMLVTLPVTSSQLFYSKLIVYLLFQIKKDIDILLPVTLGVFIFGISVGVVNIGSLFYMLIILVVNTILLVFLGSLLSIPALYIYKWMKNYPIVELILVFLGVIIFIVLAVLLIGLIPDNIDLINQWPSIRNNLNNGINAFKLYVYPIAFIVRCMSGELIDFVYTVTFKTLWMSAILIGATLLLGVIVYLAIKPFYFNMMTKTNEFNKEVIDSPKMNKRHRKYVTFANKELKLSFRDFDISGSYIAIYVIVPILLYFMNKVYGAFATSQMGKTMIIAFSILLTVLPYLASNSLIATLYSKEGRAGYIKKTKPIDPLFPLVSKVLFNLILSVPYIIDCMVFFGIMCGTPIWGCILLGVAFISIQYGHIFYSAGLDIMNPQNEAYATDGEQINNPNENKATIVGFVTAFIYAGIAYLLMQESIRMYGNTHMAIYKLLLIALLYFGATFMLFFLKVRAFYYEK